MLDHQTQAQLARYSLDVVADMIIWLDQNGRYVLVNKTATQFLGYSEDELTKLRVVDVDPQFDEARWQQHWMELKQCGSIKLETVNTTKAGVDIPIEVVANLVNFDGKDYNCSIVRDISERKRAEAELLRLSNQDSLTGLPNLRLAQDRLKMACNTANRESGLVALLFLDLDGFKEINDTYGHKAGDHVLKSISIRASSQVRSMDTVARKGGDEFLIVLNGVANTAAVREVAKKILDFIRKPIPYEENNLIVGGSIGIAIYPTDTQLPEELIHCADLAMYRVKRSGKNGVELYNTELNPSE